MLARRHSLRAHHRRASYSCALSVTRDDEASLLPHRPLGQAGESAADATAMAWRGDCHGIPIGRRGGDRRGREKLRPGSNSLMVETSIRELEADERGRLRTPARYERHHRPSSSRRAGIGTSSPSRGNRQREMSESSGSVKRPARRPAHRRVRMARRGHRRTADIGIGIWQPRAPLRPRADRPSRRNALWALNGLCCGPRRPAKCRCAHRAANLARAAVKRA